MHLATTDSRWSGGEELPPSVSSVLPQVPPEPREGRGAIGVVDGTTAAFPGLGGGEGNAAAEVVPPPVAAPPLPGQVPRHDDEQKIVEAEYAPVPWFESSASWFASLTVHLVALIAMGLWVYEVNKPIDGGVLAFTVAPPEEESASLAEFELPADTVNPAPPDGQADFADLETSPALPRNMTLPPDDNRVPRPAEEVNLLAAIERDPFVKMSQAVRREKPSKAAPRRTATDGGVVEADGIGGAVDGVLATMRGNLAEDNLLVVWLFDASISLQNDRQQIAEKIEPFYHEVQGRDRRQSTIVTSAVVAFGRTPVEVVAPTKFGGKITAAVRELPLDPSGLENVFTATQFALEKYRKKATGRLMFVIWTDESGDDGALLEDTIYMCRDAGAMVHVVGPSSVLGTDRGLQSYTDPNTGFRFMLPVKRGPDTCFPERIMLPYWYDASFAPTSLAGAFLAEGMPWYGGALREGVMAGIGPWALTRLALETGGTFTLFDRPGDRSQYRLETMKRYLPDYFSAVDYRRDLEQRPLRKATFAAANTTYQKVNLSAPKFEFMSVRMPNYPFTVLPTGYIDPPQFRNQLAADLHKQIAHVTQSLAVIETALTQFGNEDWEDDYLDESSARWRAWYDLTRGRLLAMSVRHQEYLLACQWLAAPGSLGVQTNHIIFRPAQFLRSSDSAINTRSEEAARLLGRCVSANPGTPWEQLARWELEHGLGIAVEQVAIPKPPPPPPMPAMPALPAMPLPAPPRISLPNL